MRDIVIRITPTTNIILNKLRKHWKRHCSETWNSVAIQRKKRSSDDCTYYCLTIKLRCAFLKRKEENDLCLVAMMNISTSSQVTRPILNTGRHVNVLQHWRKIKHTYRHDYTYASFKEYRMSILYQHKTNALSIAPVLQVPANPPGNDERCRHGNELENMLFGKKRLWKDIICSHADETD